MDAKKNEGVFVPVKMNQYSKLELADLKRQLQHDVDTYNYNGAAVAREIIETREAQKQRLSR